MYLFGAINVHLEGLGAGVAILVLLLMLSGLFVLALLPALLIAGTARRQAEHIRNERSGTVIARYEPPRGLTAAEIGLLYDMRCGQDELIATLFDLEQRSIIRILDDNHVIVLDSASYEKLFEYEQLAIQVASGGGTQLSQQNNMMRFKIAVQASIRRKGYPMRSYAWAFIIRMVVIAILFGLLPLLTAGVSGQSNGETYAAWSAGAWGSALFTTILAGFFLFPLYLLVGFILIRVWVAVAGRYWLNTKQVRAIWPELEGYKLYLNTVDLDAIRFESTTQSRDPVTTTLPYAIVFGLKTDWQQRLDNRRISQ